MSAQYNFGSNFMGPMLLYKGFSLSKILASINYNYLLRNFRYLINIANAYFDSNYCSTPLRGKRVCAHFCILEPVL
jgi:hypothetical protein